MKHVTTELIEVFWEDDKPVAILLMNGHAEFFRTTKATKDFVRQELLGVGSAPPVIEESVTAIHHD